MAITSALVLFAVIWFMVLLIALPIRLQTQGDVGQIVPGTHAGSPADLNLRKKFRLVTVIAVVLWAIIAGTILFGGISVRDLDWFDRMATPAGEIDG